MKLFFDTRQVISFEDLISYYKPQEFRSPTRSTIPLLSLIKHGGEFWKSVVGDFATEPYQAHLEFTVPPPQGKGIASHTDVMLQTHSRSHAIEAKWTEPRYDTVEEWIAKGKNQDNRRAVMDAWLSRLKPLLTKPLNIDAFRGAVYQMVHRAASACELGRSPSLTYLQFTPLPDGVAAQTDRLKTDLAHLHEILGNPINFPFFVIEVVIEPTSLFEKIKNLPKGSIETARIVCTALREGPLFIFKGCRVSQITNQTINSQDILKVIMF